MTIRMESGATSGGTSRGSFERLFSKATARKGAEACTGYVGASEPCENDADRLCFRVL
jgi:hypothetical protein